MENSNIRTFNAWRVPKMRAQVLCGSLTFLTVAVWVGWSSAQFVGTRNIQKSRVIASFQWLGDEMEYATPRPGENPAKLQPVNDWFAKSGPQMHGDTFPMTWADDDEIYTSAGDPSWGGKNDGLDIEKFSGDPPDYTIARVNPMSDYKGSGGEGKKPTGMICVDGVLYLAFQNLLGPKPPAYGPQDRGRQGEERKVSQHGSDAMIVSSRDHGHTWTPAINDIKEPMFPGDLFGGPAFVNNGKDNTSAPDEYVYAVSANQSDNGSTLRVGRVPADRITDRQAWQWVSDLKDSVHPAWTGDLEASISVLTDPGHISTPDMAYIAAAKRYILLNWSLKQPFSPLDGSELTIYDAPHPWGPFTLVYHEDLWESVDMNAYCPRLPLKWLHAGNGELAGWLQFSGSWRKDSPHYRSHVRRFKMMLSKQ